MGDGQEHTSFAFELLIKEVLEGQRTLNGKFDEFAKSAVTRKEYEDLRGDIETIKSNRLPTWLYTAILPALISGGMSTFIAFMFHLATVTPIVAAVKASH